MKKLTFKYRLIKTIVCLAIFISLLITFHLYHNYYLSLFAYLTLYLYVGYNIIIKSFRNVIKGKLLDENFLMLIASIGAFFLSDFSEAVAVLLFYEIGELFQNYAVNKTRKSITELMDTPEEVTVERNGVLERVDPYEVELGETLVVKNGESIPIDGEIVFGEAFADAKALTGESVPYKIKQGDKVLSGVIVNGSLIKVKTSTLYENSTINKICDMVQNVSEKKSKSEKFITKFAKYYTPIVVSLAFLTLIISLVFKIPFQKSLFRALTFLVISCPCALVISVPITFFGGLSSASKQGILIKGGAYLEKLAKVNNYAFDKTGTLTKGEFKVIDVIPCENKKEILKIATLCESISTHPIANAILKEGYVVDSSIYTISEIAGKGIIAKNETEVLLCGSYNFMVENNIEIFKNTTNYTKIYIAKNNKLLGEILIGDELKQEATFVINKLNVKNNVSIISGDNEDSVKFFSNQLFVKQMFYELLPYQKVEILEKLIAENKQICFVGDGINDTACLARADVGIAMGNSGADVALEYADVVIINDDLNKILTAKKIAKKTIRIVKQNVVLSLLIKFAVMVLSAFGFANMWLAIFADVGVAFLAILNAMRTFIKSKK